MNVAFAAGGTGGHINPALAIADKLKEVFPDTNILFIGSPDGLEAKLVKKAGYDFASVKMAGIQRKLTPHNIKLNVQAVHYYLSAGKRIKRYSTIFARPCYRNGRICHGYGAENGDKMRNQDGSAREQFAPRSIGKDACAEG